MAIDISAQLIAIMNEYQTQLDQDLEKAARKTAKECADDLNEASSVFPYSGHSKTPYAESWTSKKDENGGYTTYSKVAGLPHLLEHGHQIIVHGKNAGFQPGKPHIGDAANKAIEAFEKRAREAAQK